MQDAAACSSTFASATTAALTSSGSGGSVLKRMRGGLGRIIRGKRGVPRQDVLLTGEDAARQLEAERRQWAAERQLLLDDCTAIRAEAQTLALRMEGWTALVRDIFFYGALHDHVDLITHVLCSQLREHVSEVDGVSEVDVSELRLPSSSEFAPELQLLKYCGPELSEWQIRWEPPPAQAACSIMLHGRKFGVTFALVVSISKLRLDGELQCCCDVHDAMQSQSREQGGRTLRVGFKRMPEVSFEMALDSQSKVLALGHDTLCAWIKKQIDHTLKQQCVLPNAIEVVLPAGSSGGIAGIAGIAGGGGGGGGSASASGGSGSGGGNPFCVSPGSSSPVSGPSHASAGEVEPLVVEPAMQYALQRLLALRVDTPSGPTWLLNDDLAQALGAPLHELRARRPKVGSTAPRTTVPTDVEWGTTLVLALLQLRYHDLTNIWSPVVEARRNATLQVLMRAAMEAVCALHLQETL